jgi:hypothetical protein
MNCLSQIVALIADFNARFQILTIGRMFLYQTGFSFNEK